MAPRRDASLDEALKLYVVLQRAAAATMAVAAHDIARHGLTVAEFGVLEALYHKGPLLLGELQKTILVSSGGVTYLVDKLVDRGWVERRPCPGDRRARYAALTGAGEELMKGIFPEHAARIAEAVGGIGAAERRKAIGILKAIGREAEGKDGIGGKEGSGP